MANYVQKREDPLPALPCPECRCEGRTGTARIGNKRTQCTTCNNFARNVERLTQRKWREQYPEVYRSIRLQVEYDLYPQVIEDWSEQVAELDRRAEAERQERSGSG